MNLKKNKTKITAVALLLLLLILSALIFVMCSKEESIDLEKRFNVDDGRINFLCMRSISNVFPEYTKNIGSWIAAGRKDGLYIAEREEFYVRPKITYAIIIRNSDWGDGRTYVEKHIEKYKTSEYSMNIIGYFYAFQGEVGKIRYEFAKNYAKGEKIGIYNNDELVAEVYVITKLKMSEDFYKSILDNTLFTITVDKYSEIESSIKSPNFAYGNIEPNLDIMELSYLSIRDVRNSNEELELVNYDSIFTGGYSSIPWEVGYDDVVNKVKLEIVSASLESNIKIDAEFYEYREHMGEIQYFFAVDEEKGNYVKLYSTKHLIGEVYYSSESDISQGWMIDFLNENLVVINMNKGD